MPRRKLTPEQKISALEDRCSVLSKTIDVLSEKVRDLSELAKKNAELNAVIENLTAGRDYERKYHSAFEAELRKNIEYKEEVRKALQMTIDALSKALEKEHRECLTLRAALKEVL